MRGGRAAAQPRRPLGAPDHAARRGPVGSCRRRRRRGTRVARCSRSMQARPPADIFVHNKVPRRGSTGLLAVTSRAAIRNQLRDCWAAAGGGIG